MTNLIRFIILFGIGIWFSCCNSKQNEDHESLNRLEEQNTRLKLKKENLALEEQLKNIEEKKNDAHYKKLVTIFESERKKAIQNGEQQLKISNDQIAEIQRSCNCDIDPKNNETIGNEPERGFSYLLYMKLMIQSHLDYIENCRSEKYRAEWMKKHGYIER